LAERFKFHLGKVQCAKAYLLLCQGLKEGYGISDTPYFSYGLHNKPFLKDYPDIHFNLSHCKTAVLCVMDNVPVGCDIEHIRGDQSDAFLHYCFNSDEVAIIKQSPQPGLTFTKMWTMKEAVVKWSGEGIHDNMRDLLTADNMTGLDISTHYDVEKNYVFSICKESKK